MERSERYVASVSVAARSKRAASTGSIRGVPGDGLPLVVGGAGAGAPACIFTTKFDSRILLYKNTYEQRSWYGSERLASLIQTCEARMR